MREVIITVVLALVIFFLARLTIQTYEVFQTSMEPNFHEGQRIIVSKVAYWDWFGEPHRGDVIVFNAPNGSEEDFIKRVIGLPGDTVEIKDHAVYVNGIKLDESEYIVSPPNYTMAKTLVPSGKYFVLGDNRNNSNDSHNSWFVDRDDIHGKAWLSTWPPELWGVVPDYALDKQLVQASN